MPSSFILLLLLFKQTSKGIFKTKRRDVCEREVRNEQVNSVARPVSDWNGHRTVVESSSVIFFAACVSAANLSLHASSSSFELEVDRRQRWLQSHDED